MLNIGSFWKPLTAETCWLRRVYSEPIWHVYIIVLSAAALISGTAAAQTESEHRLALVNQGFTPAEFKAADLTQINPHYHYFEAWRQCAVAATRQGIEMQGSTLQTYSLAVQACSSEAMELRASLGREIGVARADRVIELLRANLRLTIAEARPDAPLGPGSFRINSWIIVPKRLTHQCMALLVRNSILSVALYKQDSNMTIFLYDTQHDVPSVKSQQVRALELSNLMTGNRRLLKTVDINPAADGKTTIYSIKLTLEEVTDLKGRFGLTIFSDSNLRRDISQFRDIWFEFDGLGKAPIEALMSC